MAKKIGDPYSQEAKYGAIFGETDRNMEKNMEANMGAIGLESMGLIGNSSKYSIYVLEYKVQQKIFRFSSRFSSAQRFKAVMHCNSQPQWSHLRHFVCSHKDSNRWGLYLFYFFTLLLHDCPPRHAFVGDTRHPTSILSIHCPWARPP
jgi:hypothetical protein